MGEILTGTSSFADTTGMLARLYYPAAMSPREYLSHYATDFRTVEINSTFYSFPSRRTCQSWVERTPDNFIFNIKPPRIFTRHGWDEPVPKGSTEKPQRRWEPKEEEWAMFKDALVPLHEAGKLGCLVFQFPEWYIPKLENWRYIEECQERLAPYQLAVEMRNNSWVKPDRRQRYLAWLKHRQLVHVCVDTPYDPAHEGIRMLMPWVPAITHPEYAIFKFHTRDLAKFTAKGGSVVERFNYDYSEAELAERVPDIQAAAQEARMVFVEFNNCYADNAIRNAKTMAKLLEA